MWHSIAYVLTIVDNLIFFLNKNIKINVINNFKTKYHPWIDWLDRDLFSIPTRGRLTFNSPHFYFRITDNIYTKSKDRYHDEPECFWTPKNVSSNDSKKYTLQIAVFVQLFFKYLIKNENLARILCYVYF